MADKLDTYQAETARRIEQLGFRLRRRDAVFIEGLSGTAEPESWLFLFSNSGHKTLESGSTAKLSQRART